MPLQRYRPVLTESFVERLHSRGVDVDAVCIEPGASQRQAQRQVVVAMQSAGRCVTSTAMFSWMGCTLPRKTHMGISFCESFSWPCGTGQPLCTSL